MKVIDISMTVNRNTPVFEGDTPLCIDYLSFGQINTSEIKFTPHVGTHVDLPYHFGYEQPGAQNYSIETFVGLAYIADVSQAGKLINIQDMPASAFNYQRILLKTNHPEAGISKELANKLTGHDVRLIGISTASIDPKVSIHFEAHYALLSHDICILENICLQDVEAGLYELHAVPLKWEGIEASPVRAYLIKR